MPSDSGGQIHMRKYFLIMRSGPTPGSKIAIAAPTMVIGREISNDIPIVEPEVSRKHARLIQQDDGFMLEDLGSTNGTFINGVRISSPQLLKAGDLITLGDSVSLLFIEDVTQPVQSVAQPLAESVPQSEEPMSWHEEKVDLPSEVLPEPAVIHQPIVEEKITSMPEKEVYVYEQANPQPQPKKKFPTWLVVLLILLIVLCLIPGLILTFMPTSWWCFLASLFNYYLAGCPL